jgi:hypothetical protein
MNILKFKQFESFDNDFDFPTFGQVENYFYDFTDEIDSKLYGYQSGFKFYLKPHPGGENLKNIVSKKSNFIDILNTDIPDKRLKFCTNYCNIESINFSNHFGSEIALNSIKGGAKAYKHLMIQFADTLFSKPKLDFLIECLKRFYHVEGFRPYGDLWTEDWIRPGYSTTEENLGFTGLLVNCSDEEYIKMAQLIEERPMNKKLIQHFI